MFVRERDGQVVLGSIMRVSELVDDYERTITRDWLDDEERDAVDKAFMIMSAFSLQEWRNVT